MSELPEGWVLAAVDELSVPGGVTDGPFGSNLKTEHYTATGPRVVRLQNIGDGRFVDERAHISEAHYERLAKHEVVAGDVLVASLGELLPRACLAPASLGPAIVKADCIRIRPHPEISATYLMWSLNSPDVRAAVGSSIKGVGRPRVNLGDLRRLPIPVAPTAEQERIVVAIEEAFSKLDAGQAGLRTVRQLLKHVREAVLAAAVAGNLVPHDPADAPGAKLLADLGVDPIDDPHLPLLPTSWSWAHVQDVGEVDLGRQRSPKYHNGDNMKPYLRVANVFEDRIDTSDVMEMHFEPEAFERSRLVVGDILLNEGQTPELLGRPAMYRGDPPDVAFTNSLLRFRAGTGIEPEWALLVFRRHMHSGRFTRESRITTNIAHLSAARFKFVEFPVPPAEEQRRIVDEFAKQSSFIEACERAVDAGLRRSTALRRSVLKAAFEGRLVPQDPLDEPASVLLERIRAERARSDGSGGGRRRKEVEAS